MSPFRRDLEYFLVLCQTLNISQASESTGIQQAGLSKSLKALEEEFEQKLFYRTPRGLKITPFGQVLKRNLQKTQELWEDSLADDMQRLDSIIGSFTIGAHASIAQNALAKMFPEMMERHEGLQLEIQLKRSIDITKSVIDFDLDIGIVANPLQHSDLVIVPLYKEFIGVWGQKKKTLAKTLYYNPEMIQIIHTLKKYKTYKTVEIADYEVLASIASQSSGLAILPNPVAEKYSRLKLVGKKITDVNVCMIYRHDTVKTLAFKETLKAIKLSTK